MSDPITIKILEDGRLRVETGSIGEVHHTQADRIMKYLAELFGDPEISNKVEFAHSHTHSREKIEQR